ncbi:SoxR reducing system RseC family protein [Alkalilimnicola ehrlichii]|uniref:SoxR reducing system RseC family protein n=1 Tax=Alkalilimnicola ehrlichii TaxID=351052 RepID=UPI003BA21DAA
MIEQQATVMARDGDHVWVEAHRQSTCSGCAAQSGCGTGALGRWLPGAVTRLRVADPLGVRPGEQVVIAVAEGAVLRGSVMVYLVPLLGLLGGALAGEQLSAWLSHTGDALALMGGVSGLLLGFALARRVGADRGHRHRMQPVLVRRC